ncbi:MAG TPA: SusC/RagA family TonB-linked outer membrane protein, partial [Rikenellaceae bacterium]|nr:SusC/RagA family TonB-linked outer membrane protein [Rikenellaceae bacterium]
MLRTVSKKVMSILAVLLTSIFCSTVVFAQNRQVSGVVIDDSGLPVIGAGVVVVGQRTIGTTTDLDGKFVLSVPAGASLEFSCIGYDNQVVAVGTQSEINVKLASNNVIEETVVIGYGVQKKSDLTGSVASVRAEDLNNRSSSDAAAALQGKAAGVTILSSSGAPGSESNIRVRGYSSNSGNIGPLLIVDGLKVDNIQYLDPQMIENIEVLKDAASAAIYGAEAGNGVVLVTTKAGKAKDGQVFYNMQMTLNSLGKKAEVMNAAEYIQWQEEAGSFTYDDLVNIYGYDGKTDTNWADALFGTSWTKRHTVGVQGSNDKGKFYVSLSNFDNDGIVRGDKDYYKRLTAQINAEYKIKKWLSVGTNTSFEHYNTQSVGEHSEYSGSAVLGASIMDPLTPVYYENDDDITLGMKNALARGVKVYKNEEGKYYAVSKLIENDAANPLIFRDRTDNSRQGINVRGSLYANLTPIKGLVITSRFGFRLGQSYTSSYEDPYYANAKAYSDTYSVSSTTSNNYYYQWENFANYDKTFGKHNLSAMVGMSFIENKRFSNGGTISGTDPLTGYEPNFHYISFANASATKTLSGGQPSRSASLAYFGRLAWNYDGRYNLQANFRADAFDSSKLSLQNRWGYFPSFSAGWTVSNEPFFKDNVDRNVVNQIKLRASWGRNGNISVLSGYPYATTISLNSQKYQYDVTDPTYVTGSKPSGLANPDLTWETSEQIDLGLDTRFFNNRLTFAMDYYMKKTKDLLVPIKPAAEVGIGSTTINAGNVDNSGLEIELGWRDQIGDFSYSINANMATLKNKVTYLDPTVGRVKGAYFSNYELITYFEEGYPVWYMRGYNYEGVNPETGEPIFTDKDQNGVINSDDMDMVGSGIPDLTYGITINLGYKNFDFTLFGSGAAGNDIYSCVYRTEHPRINSLKYFFDNRWTPENKGASMPSVANIATNVKFWSSTANLFNGS